MKALDLIIIPIESPDAAADLPHLNPATYPRQCHLRGVPQLDESAFDEWVLGQKTPVTLSLANSTFAIGVGSPMEHPLERLRPEGVRRSDPELSREATLATVLGHLRRTFKTALLLAQEGSSDIGIHPSSLARHVPQFNLAIEPTLGLIHRLALSSETLKGVPGQCALAGEMDLESLFLLQKYAALMGYENLGWSEHRMNKTHMETLLSLIANGNILSYKGREGLTDLVRSVLGLNRCYKSDCAEVVRKVDPALFERLGWEYIKGKPSV